MRAPVGKGIGSAGRDIGIGTSVTQPDLKVGR
jgi:hypothetical protein